MYISIAGTIRTLVAAVASRGSTAAAELIFTLAVARILGAAEAGLFFLAFSAFILAVTLARSGPDIGIVRRTAVLLDQRHLAELKTVSTLSIVHVLSIGLIAGAVLYVAVPMVAGHNWNLATLKHVSALVGLAVAPTALMYLAAEAIKGFGHPVLSQIMYGGPVFGISILLLAAGNALVPVLDAEDVAMAFSVGSCLAIVFSGGIWAWKAKDVWRESFARMDRSVVIENLTLGLIRPVSMIMIWIPNLVLGAVSTSGEVAAYTVALRLALAVGLVLFAIEGYAAPKFAALYARAKLVELRRLFTRVTGIGVAMALPAVVVMYGFAEPLMGVFFGGQTPEGSGEVLKVLVLAQLVNVITGPVAALLLMTNAERWLQAIQFLTLAIAAGVFAWRIPTGGAVGAAEGYFVVVCIMNLGFWLVGWHRTLGRA